MQQDGHCIVSQGTDYLVPCHVLALAWWDGSDSRRGVVPEAIVSTVANFGDTTNDLRN